MTSRSRSLAVGDRVRVRGIYLDEARTVPVVGTIEDVFQRPDWGNTTARVVMFEHDEPGMPPGGEFPSDRLVVLAD